MNDDRFTKREVLAAQFMASMLTVPKIGIHDKETVRTLLGYAFGIADEFLETSADRGTTAQDYDHLTQSQLDYIRQLLSDGLEFEAIHEYRDATGASMLTSQIVVQTILRDMRTKARR